MMLTSSKIAKEVLRYKLKCNLTCDAEVVLTRLFLLLKVFRPSTCRCDTILKLTFTLLTSKKIFKQVIY